MKREPRWYQCPECGEIRTPDIHKESSVLLEDPQRCTFVCPKCHIDVKELSFAEVCFLRQQAENINEHLVMDFQINQKDIDEEPDPEANDKVRIPDYTDDEIENCFTYHKPKEGQPERYEKIRAAAKAFAYVIDECCPIVRGERFSAMQHLDAAVFFANASIARE